MNAMSPRPKKLFTAIPQRSAQSLEQLFLEVRGFLVHWTGAHDAAPSERHHGAGSATARVNSSPARTCQHIAASGVVPAHEIGLDGVLPEQHCYKIVDMSGRDVSVHVHALQSLNQSRFDWVSHHRFNRYRRFAVQGLRQFWQSVKARRAGPRNSVTWLRREY
jgi:hypothetical protein